MLKPGCAKKVVGLEFLGTQGLQSCGPATRAERQQRKKNGKTVENLPRSKMGKNGRKNTEKNGKSGLFFHFFGIFRPFFSHFRLGQIFHGFLFFFPLLSFGPCSRPARLQHKGATTIIAIRYCKGSEDAVFLGKNGSKSVRIVKYYCRSSETGRIRFRRVRFQTPKLSEFFGPRRVPRSPFAGKMLYLVVLFKAVNWLLAGVRHPSAVWYLSVRHTSRHGTPPGPSIHNLALFVLSKHNHGRCLPHCWKRAYWHDITHLEKSGGVVMLKMCWSMCSNQMQQVQQILFVVAHIEYAVWWTQSQHK